MLDTLNQLDQQLFLYLNSLNTPSLDPVFWFITANYTWIPFYLILVGLIVKHFSKSSWMVLVGIGLIILMSDRFTSGFMKPYFARLRPCHNPEISSLIHLVDGCGGRYGFASSHAANTFALATFLFLLFRKIYKHIWLIFLWASIVSYSRIYVGVHYPGDIITGAILGSIFSFLVFRLMLACMNKWDQPALQKIKPLH